MSEQGQFSLKAILIVIAVVSVPLAMMASGNFLLSGVGFFVLFVASGGSLGYLLGGWKYAVLGVAFGLYVAVLFLPNIQVWLSDV